MNPYQELNVEPIASQDEIKKSYHRKAKENHPDKGGDPQAMENINRAYALIKDARSREYYDKHGEGQKIDSELSQAVNIAFQIIAAAIENNPDDIKFFFQSLRGQWQSEFNTHIHEQETKKKKIINFQKRIKHKPKDTDFISNFLNEQIKALDMNIENFKLDWSARQRAFTLLDKYSFTDIERMQTLTFTMTATSATQPW